MTKYILHPGWIRARNDSDHHFIHPHQLIQLYGVSPRDCIQHEEQADGDDVVHLYPSISGNYKLPKDTEK